MKALIAPEIPKYIVVEYDDFGTVKKKHRFLTKEKAKNFAKNNGVKFRYKGKVR